MSSFAGPINGGDITASSLTVISEIVTMSEELQGQVKQDSVLITHADTPYTTPDNVSIIKCDVVAGILIINLPAVASSTNRRITILDWTGHAAAFNITIAAQGGETINGLALVKIVTNNGGAELYCDGIVWKTLQVTV